MTLEEEKQAVPPAHINRGTWIVATVTAILLAALPIILGRLSAGYNVPLAPESGIAVTSGTTIGSPGAPVTIVEYSDFQCSHCQQFVITVKPQLDSTYIQTGKVRLIYKHMIAFGSESLLAAEAAEYAAGQNKFWPFYDMLMQLRASPSASDLSAETLQNIAEQLGLDTAALNASLQSERYRAKVLADDAEAKALGIKGVPAFFVNGVKAPDNVSQSFTEFRKVIDDALGDSGK
jgi:protein-disulfide isomerase